MMDTTREEKSSYFFFFFKLKVIILLLRKNPSIEEKKGLQVRPNLPIKGFLKITDFPHLSLLNPII